MGCSGSVETEISECRVEPHIVAACRCRGARPGNRALERRERGRAQERVEIAAGSLRRRSSQSIRSTLHAPRRRRRSVSTGGVMRIKDLDVVDAAILRHERRGQAAGGKVELRFGYECSLPLQPDDLAVDPRAPQAPGARRSG